MSGRGGGKADAVLYLSQTIRLLPRAFCSLGFALQAFLGAGIEIFQDLRGSVSSPYCYLFFKVPLYFLSLAF